MLSSTGAISAAIVVGAADGMRCRAKIGATVPDVGTPLYSGIGLSGLCLQTGEVQLSNDTNVDSRVDLEACKKLGIRSLLVLPLKANTAVLGVLELASVNANAFSPLEVARMSSLADELLRFVSEAPAIPDTGQNFAQLRTGKTIPSDIDLQEVLAAAYVIHEHGPVPQNILQMSKPEAETLDGKSESTVELMAVLSPQFGQEYPTGTRWSRTGVAIILIMAGLFFCGYHIDRSAKTATKGGTVQTANPDRRSNVARNQVGYEQKQKTERALKASITANVQKAVPGISGAGSSAELSRGGGEVAAADSSADVLYAKRTGVLQDNSGALARFAEGAAKGDPRAQWELGQGYLNGIGVTQDDRKAAEWFKKAANQGHTGAQSALSQLYFSGRGVPRDYIRAYTWASIAAGLSGNQNEELKEMASVMTELQLRAAQRRISNWWTRAEQRAENRRNQ